MEGVVEPNPGYRGEWGIEFLFDGSGHDFEGTGITRIGLRRIAIKVSSELVE